MAYGEPGMLGLARLPIKANHSAHDYIDIQIEKKENTIKPAFTYT